MEFTIPAEIGNYLPLEVKLNIVLEVAFNSTSPACVTPADYRCISHESRHSGVTRTWIPWIAFSTLLVSPSAIYKFIGQF